MSIDATSESVRLDRLDGSIAVVRLDRPAKRNALDSAALGRLVSLLEELTADETLRAVVLSTTSTRALCAGADVGEVLDTDAGLARMTAFTRLYAALDAVPVPLIAVCVGNCVGAGAELVAGADLRVVGDNLQLAWAGARLGVPVGPARLAPLVGLARAKDLVFTGRVVDATEAVALGLATTSVPAEDAEPAALELAARIAAQDAAGVRVLKRMFHDLDATAARVAHENDLLLRFQRDGTGLPRGVGR